MDLTCTLNQLFFYHTTADISSEYNVRTKTLLAEAFGLNSSDLRDQVLNLPEDLPSTIIRSEIISESMKFKYSTALSRSFLTSNENEDLEAFLEKMLPGIEKLSLWSEISSVGALSEFKAEISDNEFGKLRDTLLTGTLSKELSDDSRSIEVTVDHYYESTVIEGFKYLVKIKIGLSPQIFIMNFDIKLQGKLSRISPEDYRSLILEFAKKLSASRNKITTPLNG